MRVDVFSDVVCPWCYVGKRHLESALADATPGPTDIHWHAFQLNPDLPPEGRERSEYLRAKFGSAVSAERLHGRVTDAGKEAGIEFQFDKITRSPNTFQAHRLIQLAQTRGLGNQAAEMLFRGYFLDGRDLGDAATLAALGHAAGLEGDLDGFLAGEEQADTVRADLALARQIGISGVPFYILGNRYTLSGAQPAATFVQALKAAQQKAQSLN
ncbi:MAG: DsbA family oxidoreductase [Gammaproteobacteria bacterium]